MPAQNAEHRVLVSRVAALGRHRTRDDSELAIARRELRAARLADHVAKVVAEAPPLTAEQCERIAVLLRAGAHDAA